VNARHKSAAYVFGTLVQVSMLARCTLAASEASDSLFREFERLHWKLHAWKSGDLVDLNRAIGSGASAGVDSEMACLVSTAARFSELANGLFNPAIGRLVALWNFHNDRIAGRPPPRAEVERLLLAPPRMTDLRLEGDRIACSNAQVQLDFGGYAKGYALDRAASLLRERHIHDALIDVGGHIMALGRCGGRPWAIGLRRPRGRGFIARLELHDGEVVSTSGDYERFFKFRGKRYAHVIDPRTGFPVRGVQAATVVAAPAADAGACSDAAASAVFVSGMSAWPDAAARMGIRHAMLVDAHGRTHVTRPLRARLEAVASE
jgi:FAD:protein FMN transferase